MKGYDNIFKTILYYCVLNIGKGKDVFVRHDVL